MQQALDSGPILMQHEVSIPLTITAGELEGTLAEIGADLLVKTLEGIQSNSIVPVPQNQDQVSWAPRITKAEAQISWSKPALDIHNQIRAMNPSPVACSVFRGQRLNVWRSFPETRPKRSLNSPGTVLGSSEMGIRVQCGEGTVLELLEVQMPGKKKISGREFANGVRLKPGESPFDILGLARF
jgi:methionyl-tRNA formyltransferase